MRLNTLLKIDSFINIIFAAIFTAIIHKRGREQGTPNIPGCKMNATTQKPRHSNACTTTSMLEKPEPLGGVANLTTFSKKTNSACSYCPFIKRVTPAKTEPVESVSEITHRRLASATQYLRSTHWQLCTGGRQIAHANLAAQLLNDRCGSLLLQTPMPMHL